MKRKNAAGSSPIQTFPLSRTNTSPTRDLVKYNHHSYHNRHFHRYRYHHRYHHLYLPHPCSADHTRLLKRKCNKNDTANADAVKPQAKQGNSISLIHTVST